MKNSSVKNKFRFNFIDIILILIILIAITLLSYIFISRNTGENVSGSKEIIYEVRLRGVREEFKDKISIGDKMTDSVKLYPIGEVIDVKYSDTLYTGTNTESATLVYSVYPERIDIIVTVKAKVDILDNMYMIGGYRVSVGIPVSFRVPNFTNTGYCITVSEVKNDE